jgi:hypothetical protein
LYAEDWVPSKKAIGGNIFIGTANLNGNLATYFSNWYFVGINVDFHRNGFVFQIDDYIGFGVTKRNLEFNSEQKWRKGKAALSFMAGGNVGYSLINNKNIRVVPLAGINFNLLSSTFFGSSDFSEHEPFLPYYKLGLYIDFKSFVLLQEHVRINNADESYTSLRLSVGVLRKYWLPKIFELLPGFVLLHNSWNRWVVPSI